MNPAALVSMPVLPTDSEERKEIPIFSGFLNYFPLAVAAVARLSKRGNDKHNPGQPLHWSRNKSNDHLDCIARHLIDAETLDPKTGEYEDAVAMAWRAFAKLQELEEKRLGKPMSRASRVETLVFPAEASPAPDPDVEAAEKALGLPTGTLVKLEIRPVPHTANDWKPGPV